MPKQPRKPVECSSPGNNKWIRTLWGLHKRAVRQRHAHILGLPAVDRVRGDTVAEQLALGAATGLAPDAVVTLLTRRVEGHDDLVPNGEV